MWQNSTYKGNVKQTASEYNAKYTSFARSSGILKPNNTKYW
jgi:hypothetical protein